MTDPVTRLNAALEGRYRVEREIGEGGMATVYLAEDLRHERKVALKVLKPELAAVVGAERFLAEIKTTANLQHPHILPLFDSGQAESFLYYVMPYVEGESLRERLDRDHQLPVDEAVGIATNMAEALDYAHGQGVIHRDIKPANVLMLSGKPVISDFGIALAVGAAGGGRLTETGLSVGTPHYMSPEQATGDRDVDPRTDVYALGCVLYEMLVGEPPYSGTTAQAVLAKILTDPAPTPTKVRLSIPPNVDAAIRRALEKLPADRFTTAEQFSQALGDAGFRHGKAAARRSLWNPLSIGATAVAALAVGLFLIAVGPGIGGSGRRSEVGGSDAAPGLGTVGFRIAGNYSSVLARSVAISADGTHIAHSTVRTPLAVRSLDDSDTQVELQQEGNQPFFSPDGEWIGFFRFETLSRISISGGAPSTIASLNARVLGGSWGSDEMIVFATTLGLYRVSAEGGEPELLAAPDPENGELYYAWPQVLPGNRSVLFTIVPQGSESDAEAIVATLDIESREQSVVLRGGSGGRYASTGHLVYSAGGQLHAVGFDVGALEVRGEPVPLSIEDVQMIRGVAADFDLSSNGTLVYIPANAPSALRTLVWVDRDGSVEQVPVPPARYVYPRISRNGGRVAVDVNVAGERDVYIWDFERESMSRLTNSPTEDFFGHWSADDRHVFFSSNRNGTINIFSRASDGSGQAELLFETASTQFLVGLTPDGDRLLVGQVRQGASDLDLAAMRLQDPVRVEILLSTEYREMNPDVSPDGNWLAYQSDASGQFEVYVGAFPDVERERRQISTAGGRFPAWAPSGEELFYRAPTGEMMAAAVRLAPDFEVEEVAEAFPQGGLMPMAFGGRGYDISPTDGRFLMTQPVEDIEGEGIMVVLNWFQELISRVPPP